MCNDRNHDHNLASAINKALDEMPKDFVIRDFLMENRSEVFDMLYEEFHTQAALEARDEGDAEGDDRKT